MTRTQQVTTIDHALDILQIQEQVVLYVGGVLPYCNVTDRKRSANWLVRARQG